MSQNLCYYGTGGIGFDVYLQDSSGLYRKIGRIGSSPRSISIEKTYRFIRIWTYWHYSAASGGVGCYEISDTALINGKGIEIYNGDGGNNIGRGIYKSIFYNSDVDFEITRSRTVNGIVNWEDY